MKICSVENCDRRVYCKDICTTHYRRILNFGYIKRTKYDPNEIFIKGNVCEMYLYDKFGKYLRSTFFDLKFLPEVKKHKWCSQKDGNTHYIATRVKQLDGKYKQLFLHQLILPCKTPYEVDHKDHNGLNNRQSNLRGVTTRGNAENRRDNRSGYAGVDRYKQNIKWRSRIRVNNGLIQLGVFDTALEGFEARQKFKKLHNLI